MAEERKFRPHVLVERFRACHTHLHDIPIDDFTAGCEEVKKIVFSLGSAFAIAAADITEKTGVLQDRKADISKLAVDRGTSPAVPHGTDIDPADRRVRMTLQWLVKHEMEKNVHRMNERSYVSGARSLLRLMWFLDFLNVLIGQLLASGPEVELRHCAQQAYEEALSKYHPWVLRKTIGAAMYLLPSKEAFMVTLAGEESSPAELKPKLADFLTMMDPVRTELWRFYDEHGLRDLP